MNRPVDTFLAPEAIRSEMTAIPLQLLSRPSSAALLRKDLEKHGDRVSVCNAQSIQQSERNKLKTARSTGGASTRSELASGPPRDTLEHVYSTF